MLIKKPGPYLIIFALWLLMFSASSQLMIIAPILPRIGAELNIPENIQGTLVTSYAIMLSLFALVTGPVSDKIGRRRILMIGTGFMSFALLLHSFA
jgi:predicted MFS family arabinose efflux permease